MEWGGRRRVAPMIFRPSAFHLRWHHRKIVGVALATRGLHHASAGRTFLMSKRRIHDDELHAQFVTFSCYRRRRLLDHSHCRQVVIAMLADELVKRDGTCCGFVVMPDHVHATIWFPETGHLSPMMQMWKSRSSRELKRFVRGQMRQYSKFMDSKQPFWQPKYYPFSVYSTKKAKEKLDYMHMNPVRAGLVQHACDWQWSSARYCEQARSVGVPLGWVFWTPRVAAAPRDFTS